MILLQQLRYPTNRYILEFPGGLVDDDESIESSALRELKEETGFVGEIVTELGNFFSFTDPWKSNEAVLTCMAKIDLDNPQNQNPQQTLDDIENISIHLLDITDHGLAMKNLFDLAKKTNSTVSREVFILVEAFSTH